MISELSIDFTYLQCEISFVGSALDLIDIDFIGLGISPADHEAVLVVLRRDLWEGHVQFDGLAIADAVGDHAAVFTGLEGDADGEGCGEEEGQEGECLCI